MDNKNKHTLYKQTALSKAIISINKEALYTRAYRQGVQSGSN